MKIEWSDNRCVVCLRERDTGEDGLKTTKGHVIPEAIGGGLWSLFLCKDCNSKMGTIEARLLDDVSIVGLAAQLLPDLPPALGAKLHSGAGYFRDDEEHGRLHARPNRKSGELELTTTDEKTRRDSDVRAEVRKKLRSSGAGDDEIERKLSEYGKATPGAEFEILPGATVHKPIDVGDEPFIRTWDEPVVPAVVPLGIAYLFAACCLGDTIYRPEWQPVRDVLLRAIGGDESAADEWRIERMRPGDDAAAPLLGLVLEGQQNAAVRVVLFRWDVWLVQFPLAEPPPERLHYARYLDTGEEETNLSSGRD